MSRTRDAIEMLKALQSRGKLSKSELASILKTKERNIYELKKELEDAGYRIESEPGRYGGYYLNDKEILKLPSLIESEKVALLDLHRTLANDKHIIGSDVTFNALNKVCATFRNDYEMKDVVVLQTGDFVIEKESLQDIYSKLKHAIDHQLETKVFYTSENNSKERTINPYDLVRIDSDWYFTGFEQDIQDFKRYKMKRASYVIVTDKKYWKDPIYKLSNYVDEKGLTNIGKEVRLKLKITGRYKMDVLESPFGSNIVYKLEDNHLIYEADLRGDYVVREKILQMGNHCTVLEPEYIKDEIKELLTEMNSLYK